MRQLSAAAVSAALLLLAVPADASGDVTSSGRGPRAADEPANKYLPPGVGSSASGAREYLPPAKEAEGGLATTPAPEYLPPAAGTDKTEDTAGATAETPTSTKEENSGGEENAEPAGESGKTTTPAPEYLPPGNKYLPPGNKYLPPENVTEAAEEGTGATEMGEDSSQGTTEAKEESTSEEAATEKASGGEDSTQSPGPKYLPPAGTYLPPDGKKPADGNGKDAGGEVDSGKAPQDGGAPGAGPAKRPAVSYLPPEKTYLPPPNETAANDEGAQTAPTTQAAVEEDTTAAEKPESSKEAPNGGTTPGGGGGYDLQPPATAAGASRKYIPPGATGSGYRGSKYLPPGGSGRKYLPPGGPRGGDRVAAAESRNTLVTVDPRDRAARARERLLKRGRAVSRARSTTTEKNEVDSPEPVEEKTAASQSTTTAKPRQGETRPKVTKPRLHGQSATKRRRQRYRSNAPVGEPSRRHSKPVGSQGTARVHVTFSRKPVQSERPEKPTVLEVTAIPEAVADSEGGVEATTEVLRPDSSQEALLVEASTPAAPVTGTDDSVPRRRSEAPRRRTSPQQTSEVFDDYDEDYVWEQLEVGREEDEPQPAPASSHFESRRSSPRQTGRTRPRPAAAQGHRKKSALPPVTVEGTRPVFSVTEAPVDTAAFVSRTANPPPAVRTNRPPTRYRPKSQRARPAIRVAEATLDTAESVSITPRPPPAVRHSDNIPSRHQLKAPETPAKYRVSYKQFGRSTQRPPATLQSASRLQTEDQLKTEEARPRYNVNDIGLDPPAFVGNTPQDSDTPNHTSRPLAEYQLTPQEDRFTYSSTDSHFKTAGTIDDTPRPPTAVHRTSQPATEYQPKAAEVLSTFSRTEALLEPPEFISNGARQFTSAQDNSNPIDYPLQPEETHRTYTGTDAPLEPPILVNNGPYQLSGAQDTNRPPDKQQPEAEEALTTFSAADTHIGSAAVISTTLHPPAIIYQTSKPPSKYQPKAVPEIKPRFHYHSHYRIYRSVTPDLAAPKSPESNVTYSRVRRSEHGDQHNVQLKESATNGNSLSLVQLLHSFFTANIRRNTDLQANRDTDSLPSATSRLPVDPTGIQSSTVGYQRSPSTYQLTPSSEQLSSSPYQVSLRPHHFSTNSHQLYHGSSVTPNLLPDTATALIPADGLHTTLKSSTLLDRDSKVGTRSSARIQEPVHEDSYSTDSLQMEELLGEQESSPVPPDANDSKGAQRPKTVRSKPDAHPLLSPIKPPRRGNGCDASLVASASNGSAVEQKKLPRDCRFGPRFPQRSLALRLRPRITENARRNETLEKTIGTRFAAGEVEASSEGAKDRTSSAQNPLSTKESASRSPVRDTSEKEPDTATESATAKARPKLNTRLGAWLLEHSTSQRNKGSPGAEQGGTPHVQKNAKFPADSKGDESRNVLLQASASQQYSTNSNATARKKLHVSHQRRPVLQRRYGMSDHRAGGLGPDADVASRSKSDRPPAVEPEDGLVIEESQSPTRSGDRSHWPFATLTRKRGNSSEDIKKSNPALENSTTEERITSNSAPETARPHTEAVSVVRDNSYGARGDKVETNIKVTGRRKLGAVNSKLHTRSRGSTKYQNSFDLVQDERSDIRTVASEASKKLEQARHSAERVRSDPYYEPQREASVPGDQRPTLDTNFHNKTGHSSHVRISFRANAATTPRAPKRGTTPREIGDYSSEESAVTDTPYHSGILGEGRPALSSNVGFTDNNEDRQIRDFLDRFLPLILAEQRPERKEERTNIQVLGKGREAAQAAKVSPSTPRRKFPSRVWSDTVPEATYEAVSPTITPAVIALSPDSEGDRKPRGFDTKHFVREPAATRAGKQPFILNITEDEPETDFQEESDCDGRGSGTCRISGKVEQWDDAKDGAFGPSSHVSRRFLHKKIAAHAKSAAQYSSGRNPLEALLTRLQTGPRRQPPPSAAPELSSPVGSGQKPTAPSAETVTEAQLDVSTAKASIPGYYLPAESTASPSENVAHLVPLFPPSLSAPVGDSGTDLSSDRAAQFQEFFQLLPQSLQSALLSSDSTDSSASSYYPSGNTPDSQGSYSLLGQNSYRGEDTTKDTLNPPTNVFQLFQFQSSETSFPEGSNLPKITSASEVNPATDFRTSDILVPPPVQPSSLPAGFVTEAASPGLGRFQASGSTKASSSAPSTDFSTKFGTQYSANIEGGRIRFGLFFPSTVARPAS